MYETDERDKDEEGIRVPMPLTSEVEPSVKVTLAVIMMVEKKKINMCFPLYDQRLPSH